MPPACKARPPKIVQTHDAAVRAKLSEPLEHCSDQGRPDALSLRLRPDGDRPQAVPADGRSSDLNGGEGDMAGNLAVFVGDQRQSQLAASAVAV